MHGAELPNAAGVRMSISPPTDIVLDVARAADPLRYREAAGRLREIAGGGTEAFGEVFDDLAERPEDRQGRPPAPLLHMPFDAAAAVNRLRSATVLSQSPAAGESSGESAFRGFEAMALAGFVEAMLPQRAEAVFGGGTAGQVWRSMLAEQIAMQMAESGGIGIADSLAAAHAAVPQQTSAAQFGALAADALVAQTERGFLSAVRPDRAAPENPI